MFAECGMCFRNQKVITQTCRIIFNKRSAKFHENVKKEQLKITHSSAKERMCNARHFLGRGRDDMFRIEHVQDGLILYCQTAANACGERLRLREPSLTAH